MFSFRREPCAKNAKGFYNLVSKAFPLTLASLSNDDGDGNENGQKAIGSDKQNNNFARASRFFVHFFAVVARCTTTT